MEQKRPQRATKARASSAAPLIQYRLYFFQGPHQSISYSHEFEEADDARAIRIAEGWREGRRAELWCGARKLKAWDADA